MNNKNHQKMPSEPKGVPQWKFHGEAIDDDALSCSRDNTHFVMNKNSRFF